MKKEPIMPKINCYNLSKETLIEVSSVLTEELSLTLEIPKDRFSFIDLGEQTIIKEGKVVKGKPSITICWKERPEETILKVAAVIKKHFKSKGIEELPIYFENIFKKIK